MKEDIVNNGQEKRVEIGDIVFLSLTNLQSGKSYDYFYEIVEKYIYNPKDDFNKVEVTSPLGSRLISSKIGDSGEYKVHEYDYHYEIKDILKRTNEKIIVDFKEKDNNNNQERKYIKIKIRK